MGRLKLGVNVDHVATLRQARGTDYPSPVVAALRAERAGADSITVHLREDRRHIQDTDLYALQSEMATHMNLEMAVTDEMLGIASELGPQDCCLVPEKREELTTEGGLDVAAHQAQVKTACAELQRHGVRVSLFIDPSVRQLDTARDVGATVVELHTGSFADAVGDAQEREYQRVLAAVDHGIRLGLTVHAGHGLNYENVTRIAAVEGIGELNIGHAIVSRAVYDGMETAVAEMRRLMDSARR